MSWTEDRVAMLRKLHADHLSSSQIAAELGGVSRNGVIGKLHRIGLAGNRHPANRLTASKPRKTRGATRLYVSKQSGKEPTLITDQFVDFKDDYEVPIEQRKTFLQVNGHDCHWPIGDPSSPDFYFCGGETDGSSPYCEHHHQMSYIPLTRRHHAQPIHLQNLRSFSNANRWR